jgi:hypothetical protein
MWKKKRTNVSNPKSVVLFKHHHSSFLYEECVHRITWNFLLIIFVLVVSCFISSPHTFLFTSHTKKQSQRDLFLCCLRESSILHLIHMWKIKKKCKKLFYFFFPSSYFVVCFCLFFSSFLSSLFSSFLILQETYYSFEEKENSEKLIQSLCTPGKMMKLFCRFGNMSLWSFNTLVLN